MPVRKLWICVLATIYKVKQHSFYQTSLTIHSQKRHITQRRMATAYDTFATYNPHTPQANPDTWVTNVQYIIRCLC